MVRLWLALLVLALCASPAAAAVTGSVQGTTLTITGDGADDTVAVTPNGTQLDFDTNGDGVADMTFDQTAFDHTVMNLGAGNDTLTMGNGLAPFGVFTIDGGPGNDLLIGGDGADVIHGGEGDDLISGARGNDALFGDAGADTFTWFPGDGSDTIEGGDGDDRFVMTGSNANEKFEISPNGARILVTRDVAAITQDVAGLETIELRMLGGIDTYTGDNDLAGLIRSIVVDGGAGADTLTGGDADETLSGGADVDTVTGGAGDDTFPVRADEGAESVDGGPGGDTIAVTGTDASDAFLIDAPGPGQASVAQAFLPTTPFASGTAIERVSVDAGAGNDIVTPTTAAAAALSFDLSGGPGDDTLTGGQLPDTLRGGDGNDTLRGGDGNDQLFGDAGDDALFGQGGSDQFHCDSPTDTLDATVEDVVDPDCIAPITLPPPPVTTPDVTPPKLRVTSVPRRITRHLLLARGIPLVVRPDEPVALDISLLGRVRRGAVLAAAPNLTLVHRTFQLSQGQRTMRLRPGKRLVGRSRRFTVTVQIVATDASRNRSTYTRTVRVR